MTTVTPSDRAETISSAKRTGAVPSQRSGRALRLLVLGTGDGAAAFRERAALAGAQLAQRFSVRVTHVVAEDGIGEQDARVVRARTAGVPVLGLADGARLLEDETQTEAPGDVAEMASGYAAARAQTHAQGGETAAGSAEEESGRIDARAESSASELVAERDLNRARGEADLSSEDEPWPESYDERRSGDPETLPRSPVLSLIRHHTEFVPDPSDVRPSDVFAESALEAVLRLPPVHAEREDDIDDKTDAGPAERAAETSAGRSASLDEADAPGEMSVSGGAAARGDSAGTGDGDGAGDAAGDEIAESASQPEAAASNAADASGKAGAGRGRAGTRTAASVAWALLPMVSIGLLTPLGIGYAAYRLRSRAIIVAMVCYSVAVGVAFAVSAAVPMRTGTHAASGALLAACVGVSWLGGTAHSFLIRRRVFR